MAFKEFVLDQGTTIKVYKRRNSRSLRLTLTPDGEVRVSIPLGAPYKAGVQFAKARADWILSQKSQPNILREGQAIGKAHHLRLIASSDVLKPASRLRTTEAVVTYPTSLTSAHPTVQKTARAVGIRALRTQAEALLPQRLQRLAQQYDFEYKSVSIKSLQRRWGSCDVQGNIVLNLYLMQLPWDCIDYVLLHELTHTQVMQHGPKFWDALERVLPAAKQLRRTMKAYQPAL